MNLTNKLTFVAHPINKDGSSWTLTGKAALSITTYHLIRT